MNLAKLIALGFAASVAGAVLVSMTASVVRAIRSARARRALAVRSRLLAREACETIAGVHPATMLCVDGWIIMLGVAAVTEFHGEGATLTTEPLRVVVTRSPRGVQTTTVVGVCGGEMMGLSSRN